MTARDYLSATHAFSLSLFFPLFSKNAAVLVFGQTTSGRDKCRQECSLTFSTNSSNAHWTPSLVFALASMKSILCFRANFSPSSRDTSLPSCLCNKMEVIRLFDKLLTFKNNLKRLMRFCDHFIINERAVNGRNEKPELVSKPIFSLSSVQSFSRGCGISRFQIFCLAAD